MTDITLINPDSAFLTDPKVMHPLGILYVLASLKQMKFDVDFIDLAGGVEAEIPQSKTFGITATTAQYPNALSLLKRLKKSYSNARVVIGGPHATMAPQECLADGFDSVVAGEGEFVIGDFVTGRRSGIIRAPYIQNLDLLPFPDRSLVADYNYTIDGKRTATMISARGCPYSCSFCCKNWGTKVRFRSARNVIREAEEIAKLGYEGIMFYDDEMLFNWERDKQIYEGIHDLGLIWRCFSRANFLHLKKHRERIRKMANMGCKEILIGVESGSDRILKNINKETTVKMNKKAVKNLYNCGVRVKAAMIVGLPGETEKTLNETWKFCEEMEDFVSDWDFSVLVPYPGSDIYKNPSKYDIFFDKPDIYHPFKVGSDWRAVVSTSDLSRDAITNWRNKFHQRFKK